MDENNIINPENQDENIPENTGEKIIKVNLENQMKSAYIDYSMSVIISRALPDVRDGLKPVHRRVLVSSCQDACNGLLPGLSVLPPCPPQSPIESK